METSAVRRRVSETIERARRSAQERRARSDAAGKDYARFLDVIAVPLFGQVAGTLKAEGYPFTVFTPSGGVRLESDRSHAGIELSLDTSGEHPMVIGRSKRLRGGNVIELERPIAERTVAHLTEEDVLQYLLKEIEPLVER